MRIGMMADGYKPHVSGITNVIALSKRFLEKAGHDVYVFTFGGDDYRDDEPNIIRTRGVPLIDTGIYVSVRYSSQAQKIFRTMDIIHVHHPFTSGRLAIRYSKSRGIPIVFTNHTRYDLYAQAYLPLLPPTLTTMDVIFLSGALKARPKAYYRPGVGSAGRALRCLRVSLGYDRPLWEWWQSCW